MKQPEVISLTDLEGGGINLQKISEISKENPKRRDLLDSIGYFDIFRLQQLFIRGS